MAYKGYSVYDNNDFFEKYTQKRKSGKSPNELIEQPIIDELIDDVSDKTILDLGCGDGRYGVELLKRGARHYYGIEGSKQMASLAKTNLSNYNATLEINDIEKANFGISKYDIAVSRLVLHYIEDTETLLKRIQFSLKDEGMFIFSIEHPVITSSYEAYHQKVKRVSWIVDNYFKSGQRVNKWIGQEVIKYHKSLEEYWHIIKKSNFEVIEIRESKPVEAYFEEKSEFERRSRIPLFLIFQLKKRN